MRHDNYDSPPKARKRPSHNILAPGKKGLDAAPIKLDNAPPHNKSVPLDAPPDTIAKGAAKKNLFLFLFCLMGIIMVLIIFTTDKAIPTPSASTDHVVAPNKQHSSNTGTASHNHIWQAATCTTPKTCQVCGMQTGSLAPHNWAAATYTTPKKCQKCFVTEGLSLGTPLSYLPVLNDSQSKLGTDITIGHLTDISGVFYDNSIVFWVSDGSGLINTEHIEYASNSNYDILTATIAIGSGSDSSAAVRFYIYGNDKLLHRTGYISGSSTEHFQLDIHDIDRIRIECETFEKCRYSYGLIDATMYIE